MTPTWDDHSTAKPAPWAGRTEWSYPDPQTPHAEGMPAPRVSGTRGVRAAHTADDTDTTKPDVDDVDDALRALDDLLAASGDDESAAAASADGDQDTAPATEADAGEDAPVDDATDGLDLDALLDDLGSPDGDGQALAAHDGPADAAETPDPEPTGRLAAFRKVAQQSRDSMGTLHGLAAEQATASDDWSTMRRVRDAGRLHPHAEALKSAARADKHLMEMVRGFVVSPREEVHVRQHGQFHDYVYRHLGDWEVHIPLSDLDAVIETAYDDMIGIGPLGPLFRDPRVIEIVVKGWDTVFVELAGQNLTPTSIRFLDLDHAQATAKALAQKVSSRQLSVAQALVTAELEGARVQMVLEPVAKSGLDITIRKFRDMLTMQALLGFGSLDENMRQFLQAGVAAHANILVSGGTGTGKTTMLNVLSEYIAQHESVITIEDACELQIGVPAWRALVTKEAASGDDTISYSLADCLRAAMRMRPDRVFVGEIRQGDAAYVMLQAANTGHDGTCSTIHANNPTGALTRLASLLREGQEMPVDTAVTQISTALDIVVQVTRRQGRRYISEIAVVDPSCANGSQLLPEALFTGAVGPDGDMVFTRSGRLRPETHLAQKMIDAGVDISPWTG